MKHQNAKIALTVALLALVFAGTPAVAKPIDKYPASYCKPYGTSARMNYSMDGTVGNLDYQTRQLFCPTVHWDGEETVNDAYRIQTITVYGFHFNSKDAQDRGSNTLRARAWSVNRDGSGWMGKIATSHIGDGVKGLVLHVFDGVRRKDVVSAWVEVPTRLSDWLASGVYTIEVVRGGEWSAGASVVAGLETTFEKTKRGVSEAVDFYNENKEEIDTLVKIGAAVIAAL